MNGTHDTPIVVDVAPPDQGRWTLAALDRLHRAIGLGAEWQASEARARYLDPVAVAARERALARRYLGELLDGLCRAHGLEPWETWRRPRMHERLDRALAGVRR